MLKSANTSTLTGGWLRESFLNQTTMPKEMVVIHMENRNDNKWMK